MNDKQAITVEWQPTGRGKAQCPADALYPEGKALDISNGHKSCVALFPLYPAPECGIWVIRCAACGNSFGVTAAGRPDDPTSIKFPCKERGTEQ